ncbi:MAG: oligosaccharide flippase family protein [Phycisphaerae bacterium]|nr:oligosaccharide flippase family protein [Phycisphaerae bacterium]
MPLQLTKIIYKCSPKALHPFYDRIEASDIGSRFVGGVFWVLIGSVLSRLLFLICFILLARVLGKESYGEFGIIRTTLLSFLVFSNMGLSLTVTKCYAQYKGNDNVKLCKIIGLCRLFSFFVGIVAGIVLFLGSSYFANRFYEAPGIISEFKLIAFILPFIAIAEVNMGLLAGSESFRSQTLVRIVSSVMLFLSVYFGDKFGVSGGVLGLCSYYLFYSMLAYFVVKRKCRINIIKPIYVKSFDEISVIFNSSLPIALTTILINVGMLICIGLLSRNNGSASVAIFDIANQWKTFVFFIPMNISFVLLPMFSSLANKRNGKFYKLYKLNILFNFFITSFVVLIIYFLSPFIVNLYGAGYEQMLAPLLLFCVVIIFDSLVSVNAKVFISRNRVWLNFWTAFVEVAILVVLSHYFIMNGNGATGIIIAFLIAVILRLCIQFILLYKLSIMKEVPLE